MSAGRELERMEALVLQFEEESRRPLTDFAGLGSEDQKRIDVLFEKANGLRDELEDAVAQGLADEQSLRALGTRMQAAAALIYDKPIARTAPAGSETDLSDAVRNWTKTVRGVSAALSEMAGEMAKSHPEDAALSKYAQDLPNALPKEVSAVVLGLVLAASRHPAGRIDDNALDQIGDALDDLDPDRTTTWRKVIQMYLRDPKSEQDRIIQEALVSAPKGSIRGSLVWWVSVIPDGQPDPDDPDEAYARELPGLLTLCYAAGALRLAQCFFDQHVQGPIEPVEDYCLSLLRHVANSRHPVFVSTLGGAVVSSLTTVPTDAVGAAVLFESSSGKRASQVLGALVEQSGSAMHELLTGLSEQVEGGNAVAAEVKAKDPGWYIYPDAPGMFRRWDGSRWTDQYKPNPPRPGQRQPTGSRDALLGFGLLIAIVALGAWRFVAYWHSHGPTYALQMIGGALIGLVIVGACGVWYQRVGQQGLLPVAGVLLGFSWTICGLFGIYNPLGTNDSGFGDGFGARDACHGWVKDQLKAPSTADFSNESGYENDKGPWMITGDVDSENSFGAQLRSPWTCEVRLDGDTYRGSATVDGQ